MRGDQRPGPRYGPTLLAAAQTELDRRDANLAEQQAALEELRTENETQAALLSYYRARAETPEQLIDELPDRDRSISELDSLANRAAELEPRARILGDKLADAVAARAAESDAHAATQQLLAQAQPIPILAP